MERATPKPRVNRTLVARFEGWALPRMARRLPAWVTPDTLTLVGLVAAVGIAAAYALTAYSLWWLWAASLGFVVHWWGDSLDGTLARVRDIRRERYGFYVDHQCDALSALLIFTGLGVSPLMPLPLALALLVGYYLMMIHVNLVTIARDVFKISFGGVGPTEARLAMIAANTLVFALGNPTFVVLGQDLTPFTAVGVVGVAALGGTYVGSALAERAALARLDPPPRPGEGAAPREADVPQKEPMGSR